MNEAETMERDEVERANRQRLVDLMLAHNITIPAREIDKWRPTEEKTGHIEGVADGLTCIMTDGLLGYFLRNGREPLYGHVGHFMWDEAETSMVPYVEEEDGEVKYFKTTKKSGAPKAWARVSKEKPTLRRRRKVKQPQITTAGAVAHVESLIARLRTGL